MSIIHIADDIKKEFEIHSDGTTSASHRGAARLLGVDRKNIDRNCRGEQMSRSYAEYLAEIGFKGGEHSGNRITDIELAIFAKYYAYKCEEKYRSKQAELVDLAFSAIGARTWIKTELSYNQPVQPKALSTKDLNLEQVMCLAGYMWVPKQRELDNPNGCEDVHVTKERFAEIMDSINPIFKEVFFCLDAGKNLMSIIKYPIELAALPEAIAKSKELNRQEMENPDAQMLFYLEEVFGDRNLTDAQILEEINDRVESKLTGLVEDLHYTAFESDRHLEATAALEAALQRRQLGGSSKKGLGFGKKSIGGIK
jgi:hypothetical protein